MAIFITITDSDTTDPSFWAGLDVTSDSTIDASAVSDFITITMTGNSISFANANTGVTTTFTDADLGGGSFSNFVEFTGNNANNDVSGSSGITNEGYIGGDGDDLFLDSGSRGGGLRGGGGNDTLIGGTGDNQIDGGAGDDALFGGTGRNNLSGGEGNDLLFAEDGFGNLDGGAGDDRLFAGLNTTFIQGGAGEDELVLPEGSTFTPFSPGGTDGNVRLPDGREFVALNVEIISFACFTPGVQITTPKGEVAVEDLCPGDLVNTLDHGPQPIRWIGSRKVSGRGRHAPIRFMPGSIGNKRSMLLSPQHRVMLNGWQCEMLYHTDEVLCAAKHLCDGDRIYREPCDEVVYYHIMFDRHEIVISEGTPTESFFAGDHPTETERDAFEELTKLFPELDQCATMGARTARPCIQAHEAAVLRN